VRFVAARPDDLIGLVTFARLPDSSCAPTLDHGFLIETAAALGTTTPDQDGTNLGDALAWALRDLQGTGSPRRVIVLLTDGRNEPGLAEALEPEAAATLIRQQGVVLHTIAIGARAERSAAHGDTPSGPDRERLQRLAALAGGAFFEAADTQALERVFEQIDRLERGPIQGTIRLRYREHFGPWALAALALLLTERLWSAGRFRRLPG
jgi:Ca-activated chloride channel family protein